MTRRTPGQLQQGLVHHALHRNLLGAAVEAVGREHEVGVGVVHAVGDGGGREAGEHHRMHRPDAGAGQHGYGQLRNHGQVDDDAVALLHAVVQQHVGELAHLLVQLAVSQAQVAGFGVVGLEDEGQLVAALRQVAVEAVLGDVEAGAVEPLAVAGRRKLAAAHAVPLAPPGEGLGHGGPESIGVFDGLLVGGVVFFEGADAGVHTKQGER